MYTDSESRDQKGRVYPNNQKRDDEKYDPDSGTLPEESFSFTPPDPSNPYAHLSSTPTVPTINNPVTIDASKSHDADKQPCVAYTFDFGDGTAPVTSKDPVLKHSYKSPGSYPVSVSVTDKYGKTGTANLTQRVVDPQSPTAMGPPYAQLTSNPTESKVQQPTYFDASKSHDFKQNQCEHFVFNFGDKSKLLHSKTPKVTHRYTKRGVYSVSVSAQDKFGQTATAGLDQRVVDPTMSDPGNPSAHLSSEPSEAKTKENVTFDASKSRDYAGNKCKKFLFDFGDNTKPMTSFKPIVTRQFAKGGTYPVTVTVTDKFGKRATAQIMQRVKDEFNPQKKGLPYVAVRNHPMESEVDEPVTFDASASHDYLGGNCDRFTWDFGDKSPKKVSTTPVVQHIYSESGSYPVTVSVTDKFGQSGTAKCNQRVEPPMPFFSRSDAEKVDDPYVVVQCTPSQVKVGGVVQLDASKSHDMDREPLREYIWDFGDGSPVESSKTPVMKHKYTESGTFPVKLIGVDKYGKKGHAKCSPMVVDGNFDPANHSQKDMLQAPYAAVTSTPTQAVPGGNVQFDASKSHDMDKKPCTKFVWDFGDGTPRVTTTKPITSHQFENPGTFPVKVLVVDKNGMSSPAGLNQKVVQDGPTKDDPYVAVLSTPEDPKPEEPVRFDASPSHDANGDPCSMFTWDFGDGSPPKTTDTPIVNHVFDKPGMVMIL